MNICIAPVVAHLRSNSKGPHGMDGNIQMIYRYWFCRNKYVTQDKRVSEINWYFNELFCKCQDK